MKWCKTKLFTIIYLIAARREREAITIEKRRIQKEEAAKQKAEKAAANTLRQQKSNGIPHQTSPLDDTDTGNLMHIDSNDAVPSTSTSIASPSISSTTFTFKNQPYTYAFTHVSDVILICKEGTNFASKNKMTVTWKEQRITQALSAVKW